mmetsp:Transcript_147012/g.259176  ORF Transcript_147012/g.259176 Transcript_147012/m.259176 type:complete len:226 (+) Transcript_147012:61-738(+)
MASGKALPFLAVGRVKDATTLASFSDTETVQQKEQTEEIFKKLLAAARQKLKPGQRTRLQWNDGSVCCLMDQQGLLLYCVVTSFMEYPERFAYQLLQELLGSVQELAGTETAPENGLTQSLHPRMHELLLKYEDPGNFDQTQQALDKVNVVKSVMQENLRQVAETGRSIQDLQSKTDGMASSARLFNTTGQNVRDKYQMRNRMCHMGMALIVLAIIAILLWNFMT